MAVVPNGGRETSILQIMALSLSNDANPQFGCLKWSYSVGTST